MSLCKFFVFANICGNFDNFRASNNETQLSFEASLKVSVEEEVEVVYEEEEVEEMEGLAYEDEEVEGEGDYWTDYDDLEWDWRSRAGDLASEKDENWDN